MKNIFNAANSAEAYMVSNMLEQHGLEAHVENKHLQEGMKEYSAGEFVRVLVADNDYNQAGKVIKEWESQQVTEGKQQNNKATPGIYWFVFGVIIGVILVFWWLISPITEAGIDYNNDGIYETKYIYFGDKLK